MSVRLAEGVRHPKIYAYTIEACRNVPWVGARRGAGLIKIGETQRDVRVRIREQLANVKMPIETVPDILLVEAAVTDDGRVFTDKNVHRVMDEAGYHNLTGEWYECTEAEVRAAIKAVRSGRRLDPALPRADFTMRPEQRRAVEVTAAYYRAHAKGNAPGDKAPDFLWNAKMRFGKTFAAYQLAREMQWTRVLVLTYKPAVEQAWREDLRHADFVGWRFHGREDSSVDIRDTTPLVWFASFQDVLGTDDTGQTKEKNRDLHRITWDVVIVDEYHFGAWRDAARSLYAADVDDATGTRSEGDPSEARAADTPDLDEGFVAGVEEALERALSVRHYLYLSGTPFRALTEGEFLEDQVFNWTYSDEQRAKRAWKGPTGAGGPGNPYASLPQMHLLTYAMPDTLREVALNNVAEFSLTEFFRTTRTHDTARFVHANEVQQWLDLLRGQHLTDLWTLVSGAQRPPLPFADVHLLATLQHTLWYLPSVDACHAMRDLLTAPHNTFFREYRIIVAAGTAAGSGQQALHPVTAAITRVPQDTKSITLSCGKLMTGVTVPAWGGILMLRELNSPETYFQAAFRVQSPWSYRHVNTAVGGEDEVVVKEHCYVIDFAPNRALRLIVEYATRLRATSASDTDDEQALDAFMEFLPVLAFDGSTMSQVNAGDVLDYLTRGISASMLARRWGSPELITLDLKAMEAILADATLLENLERIEHFRTLQEELSTLIATHKELKKKKLAKQPLSRDEKRRDDEAKKTRQSIKERLRRFITRIPAFMYLTDQREKTLLDIIRNDERELFEQVTTLALRDFERLVDAGVFHASKMNDAVWKFRQFEEPSLTYTRAAEVSTRGGWSVRRDERFAALIDKGLVSPGDTLTSADPIHPTVALVTDDYGILLDGVRQDGPDQAAAAASRSEVANGWTYWHVLRDGAPDTTLEELRHRG